MNWKEHAPLFANGKFQARINWDDGTTQERIITGYYNESDRGECFTFEATYLPIEMCTLIARPISDMTDRELIECRDANVSKLEPDERDSLIMQNEYLVSKENKVSREMFIYLLSIGVYPFDQSHFEDRTVINTNSIKE